MDERDRQQVIARYNERLARYGVDIRTLASGTEERRRLRFDVLAGVGITSGSSVLDVGCGFGDLSAHLGDLGIDAKYVGLDINPDLIAAARLRYPQAEFRTADIQRDPIEPFDFVVSTSAFNLRLQAEDNYEFASDILARSFAIARRGVAIDFMSSYVDFTSPDAFHYSPERIFTIAKQITKRVQLRHDYPLYEFCVYLYPDFAAWR